MRLYTCKNTDGIKETNDPNVRYCEVCLQSVYVVRDASNLPTHVVNHPCILVRRAGAVSRGEVGLLVPMPDELSPLARPQTDES